MPESKESARKGRAPHGAKNEIALVADSDREFFPHSQDFLFKAISTLLRSSQLASVFAGAAGLITLLLAIFVIQSAGARDHDDSLSRLVIHTFACIVPTMCTYMLFRETQKNSLKELRYFQRELQELELSKIVLREATQSGNPKALRAAASKIGKSVARPLPTEQLHSSESSSVVQLFNRR
jgi:hypothetical protein